MRVTSFLHLVNLLSTGRAAVQRHVFSELTVVMIYLDFSRQMSQYYLILVMTPFFHTTRRLMSNFALR